MKILKIEENKGYFRISNENEWTQIDEISKDDLLVIVGLVLENDVQMDKPKSDLLQNPAHKIIYGSIYEKLFPLSKRKNEFKDEADRKYLKAIEKYQQELDDNEPQN